MYLYGLALRACVRDINCSYTNGTAMLDKMKCAEFHGNHIVVTSIVGAAGIVVTDIHAERLSAYSAYALSEEMTKFLPVMSITPQYDCSAHVLHRVINTKST